MEPLLDVVQKNDAVLLNRKNIFHPLSEHFLEKARERDVTTYVSLAGLERVCSKDITLLRKMVWLFLILSGVIFIMFHSYERLEFYAHQNSTIVTSIDTPNSIDFPPLTVLVINVCVTKKGYTRRCKIKSKVTCLIGESPRPCSIDKNISDVRYPYYIWQFNYKNRAIATEHNPAMFLKIDSQIIKGNRTEKLFLYDPSIYVWMDSPDRTIPTRIGLQSEAMIVPYDGMLRIDMKQSKIFYRSNCGFDKLHNINESYGLRPCLFDRKISYAKEVCGCETRIDPLGNIKRFIVEIDHTTLVAHNWNCTQEQENECMRNETMFDEFLTIPRNRCRKPCYQTLIEKEVETIATHDKSAVGKTNDAVIVLQYQSLMTTVMVEQTPYVYWFSRISDIGGTCGSFGIIHGASLLTIAQLVDYIFFIWLPKKRKGKAKKDEESKTVKSITIV